MSARPPGNLPFLFREIAKNEVALACGVSPEESAGLLTGRPAQEALKPFATVAVLAGGAPTLPGFLALVKSQYREGSYPFPRVITPSPEVADSLQLQELREYLIVYDFVETERQVMMCLKRKKPSRASDVELAPATFADLDAGFRDKFVTAMREARHYAEEFRQPAFTATVEEPGFELVLARRDNEPAGLLATFRHDLEYRLQTLFVAPEHRGHRVGETLVSEFFERAQQAGSMFVSSVIAAGSNFFFYLGRFNFEPALKFSVWTPPAPDFFKDA